jgi:threonine dehydratase
VIGIDLKKLKKAQALLQKKGLRTPLLPFNAKGIQGNEIFLKPENLQPSGSFKIRGATYCLSLLTEEQKARGVIAYSTGNHAQSVALAAKLLGIHATIVMSGEAPQYRIDATRAYGAKIVMSEPSAASRKKLAEKLAKQHGYSVIHPYDDPDVIIGQGTIGIEIMQETTPAAVFVPIGGGGLISGIAVAVKKLNPEVKIIGVEPESETGTFQSFHSDKGNRLSRPTTAVAGATQLASPQLASLGELTYPLILHYVDDVVQVSDSQITEATLLHAEKGHLIVEPAGALALAAALTYPVPYEANRPIICITSGGNIPLSSLFHLNF